MCIERNSWFPVAELFPSDLINSSNHVLIRTEVYFSDPCLFNFFSSLPMSNRGHRICVETSFNLTKT